MPITADLLRAAGAGGNADTWAAVLSAATARYDIATPRRVAAFLARTMQETAGYTRLVESMDYSAERLRQVWPNHFDQATAERCGRTADHSADQHQIAEIAYGGRLGNGPSGCGDGWTYRGHGLIQLTGRANYYSFALAIGGAVAALPALLETPAGAAESAAHFWAAKGCNDAADRGDIEAVVRLVNGGANGLVETRALYDRIMALPGLPLCAAPAPPAPVPVPPSAPTPTGFIAWLAALFASLMPRRA